MEDSRYPYIPEFVCLECEDCMLWDGGCRYGQKRDDLPDDGSCWEYRPRWLWETKEERKARIRSAEQERKAREAALEDMMLHPVLTRFADIPGKSFQAIRNIDLPRNGALARIKAGTVYTRQQLWHMLSGYYLQKEWYEIEYQLVDIDRDNPDNKPGMVIMLDEQDIGHFSGLYFLILG